MTRSRITSDVGRYCIVPKWVAERLTRNESALAMYVHLALVANDDSRSVTRSRKELAEGLDCSLKSVDRRIAALVAAECLDVEANSAGGQRVASTYRVRTVHQPSLLDASEDNAKQGGGVTDDRTPNGDGSDTAGAGVPPTVTHIDPGSSSETPDSRSLSDRQKAREYGVNVLARSVGMDPENLTVPARKTLFTMLAHIERAETQRLGARPATDQLAGEIVLRSERYRRKHPRWDLTAPALCSRWAELGPERIEPPLELVGAREAPPIADEDRDPPDEATIRSAIARHRRSCDLNPNHCEWDLRLNIMLAEIPQAAYA